MRWSLTRMIFQRGSAECKMILEFKNHAQQMLHKLLSDPKRIHSDETKSKR